MFSEWTDFAALVVVHTGSYFKIKKQSVGWLFSISAIVYFALRGIELGLYSQTFGHVISLTLASWGYFSWRKKESCGAEKQ